MVAAGIPVVCWCLSAIPPKALTWLTGPQRITGMATFLWSLEWGGLTIALLGLGRERWLRQRRRS
jgi:hypothetical protein